MSKLRVNMLPLQAHCFAFGGFEIQMLELFNVLSLSSEVVVRKMNPWDRDSDFDVLHLWGLEQSNFNNAYWAKRNNKKVVLTALIGQIESVKDYIRFKISEKIGNVRFLLKVLENIDALVVVNELEAKKAIHFFKLPKEKVYIVPNLITQAAINELSVNAKQESSFENYFFCAGNISERKNQLMLAQAANENGVNMVFAGDFICSDSYKQRFLQIIQTSPNLEYFGNLTNTSTKLFNLFRMADGFCLPSYQETQPISVLEAAFFGKNILIGNGPYSKQHLFRNLVKVNVRSLDSVKQGIAQLKNAGNELKYTIEKNDLNKCLFSNVSKEYIKIYTS